MSSYEYVYQNEDADGVTTTIVFDIEREEGVKGSTDACHRGECITSSILRSDASSSRRSSRRSTASKQHHRARPTQKRPPTQQYGLSSSGPAPAPAARSSFLSSTYLVADDEDNHHRARGRGLWLDTRARSTPSATSLGSRASLSCRDVTSSVPVYWAHEDGGHGECRGDRQLTMINDSVGSRSSSSASSHCNHRYRQRQDSSMNNSDRNSYRNSRAHEDSNNNSHAPSSQTIPSSCSHLPSTPHAEEAAWLSSCAPVASTSAGAWATDPATPARRGSAEAVRKNKKLQKKLQRLQQSDVRSRHGLSRTTGAGSPWRSCARDGLVLVSATVEALTRRPRRPGLHDCAIATEVCRNDSTYNTSRPDAHGDAPNRCGDDDGRALEDEDEDEDDDDLDHLGAIYLLATCESDVEESNIGETCRESSNARVDKSDDRQQKHQHRRHRRRRGSAVEDEESVWADGGSQPTDALCRRNRCSRAKHHGDVALTPALFNHEHSENGSTTDSFDDIEACMPRRSSSSRNLDRNKSVCSPYTGYKNNSRSSKNSTAADGTEDGPSSRAHARRACARDARSRSAFCDDVASAQDESMFFISSIHQSVAQTSAPWAGGDTPYRFLGYGGLSSTHTPAGLSNTELHDNITGTSRKNNSNSKNNNSCNDCGNPRHGVDASMRRHDVDSASRSRPHRVRARRDWSDGSDSNTGWTSEEHDDSDRKNNNNNNNNSSSSSSKKDAGSRRRDGLSNSASQRGGGGVGIDDDDEADVLDDEEEEEDEQEAVESVRRSRMRRMRRRASHMCRDTHTRTSRQSAVAALQCPTSQRKPLPPRAQERARRRKRVRVNWGGTPVLGPLPCPSIALPTVDLPSSKSDLNEDLLEIFLMDTKLE